MRPAVPAIKMGWPTEMKILLIVLVFSKWPLTTDALLQKSSLAGMPLSDAEYENFFQTLTARRVVHMACFRRAALGCHDPAIQTVDRYENHGIIPDGWICSNFPDNTSFPSFCDFALYRCIMKKYFAKRVLCPDETTEKATATQTNKEDPVISTTETSSELPDTTPTIITQSSPKLLTDIETASLELSPKPLPTTTAKASLLELLSSSAIEIATILISQILAAFRTATEPSSEPTTTGISTEHLKELTTTATSESSSELTTSSTTTAEFLIELTSTPAIITEPKLNPATTATGSTSEGTTITTTTAAPTEPSSELATAMGLFPESKSDTIEGFGSTSHTTTSATTSNTEPCIVDYPESFSNFTTPTSSTATTHTSSASILPTNLATTPTKATTTTSSTITASPQPSVPGFDVSLPFSPPQPNGTMRILILSFIKDKRVKNGNMAGISALPQTGLGSGSILLQGEIQNPLPTNGLKDLFLRLGSKNVQQQMHQIQSGLSGGAQKPQLLSSALQLLSALNPRSDFKSRLQR